MLGDKIEGFAFLKVIRRDDNKDKQIKVINLKIDSMYLSRYRLVDLLNRIEFIGYK